MIIPIIIIIAIILAAIFLVVLIWKIRARRFRPNPNKLEQQNQLNEDLESVGFAYNLNEDYFYSIMNCWQREVGYCRLYDEGAPLFNMIIDCEPITFSYAGKRWLIELWKGQYGITTGGEIGIYNTSREDINTEKFQGTFYENIRNEERMPLSFVLKKNGKEILRRSELHWWLTGFKLGEFSNPGSLTMDARIVFPNRQMCQAFIQGLREIGYTKKEFSVRRTTAIIHYTKPHTSQVLSRNKVQETVIQQTNDNNCKLYEMYTGKYADTLDKVEFIKATMPELYEIFLKSLYAKGLFEAFGWIKDIIHGGHPVPIPPIPPKPPCPPKPCPCPPEPCPCPPKPCPCPPEPCPCPPEPCPCPPEPCPCPPKPCPCPPKPCQCPPRPCPCPPRPCPPPCICPGTVCNETDRLYSQRDKESFQMEETDFYQENRYQTDQTEAMEPYADESIEYIQDSVEFQQEERKETVSYPMYSRTRGQYQRRNCQRVQQPQRPQSCPQRCKRNCPQRYMDSCSNKCQKPNYPRCSNSCCRNGYRGREQFCSGNQNSHELRNQSIDDESRG